MHRIALYLILGLARTHTYSDSHFPSRDTGFRYVDKNEAFNEKACENTCISKCCPGSQVLVNDTCVENAYGVKLQDMKVDIYSREFKTTNKTLKDFTFVHHEEFVNGITLETGPGNILYILTDAQNVYRTLNHLKQWYEPLSYKELCVEIQIASGNITQLVYKYRNVDNDSVVNDDIDDNEADAHAVFTEVVMLISCFFLLLVLVAYAVLPEKLDLHSLIAMTYVSCLFVAFLFTAVQVFTMGTLEKSQCVVIGLIEYYTLLASFTWMNLMIYEKWTSICKRRSQQTDSILVEFCKYGLLGFGTPLVMTVFLVGIDFADLTSVPGFVKPHFVAGTEDYCYFERDDERLLYVYVPIVVTTVVNIVFIAVMYIRTQPSACPDNTRRNTAGDRKMLKIYSLLALIMNLIWFLDLIGTISGPVSWWWYLFGINNLLIGPLIFTIFVFKTNRLPLIYRRFLRNIKSQDRSVSVSLLDSSCQIKE